MIDARGQACPMPVVMTQNAIKKEKPSVLEVLVDNQTAVENVTRFAARAGYTVTVEETAEGDFQLNLRK